MADTSNKPKLQLRSGPSFNGEKTPPSPATKLLISHGKPNFTIQRSPKAQENGNENPLSPQANVNNNYNAFRTANNTTASTNGNSTNNNNGFIVSSTKFNGVFKPSNVPINDKQAHQQDNTDNEAAKVVLRRAKQAEPSLKEGEDENVPEFIRRQRRIQERLAKENVLDFENRRSGYFTHVMISPSSPNRTSFVETMSSPATIAALEIPPPAATKVESVPEEEELEQKLPATNGTTNGYAADEEEEVAKAIEEVNKAVAGEEDDKIAEPENVSTVVTKAAEPQNQENVSSVLVEETKVEQPVAVAAVSSLEVVEEPKPIEAAVTAAPIVTAEVTVHASAAVATLDQVEDTLTPAAPQQNGIATEVVKENGHDEVTTNGSANDDADVTISHTNGVHEEPCIPSPDPSGALGVNYEPKTVVSFSKDMAEPNKYPDTVKVVQDVSDSTSAELKEMAKLKFDIKADEQDVQVTPVLRAEN